MFTLRTSAMKGARFAPIAVARATTRPFSFRSALLAQGDYGSPRGDPVAENPQEQGRNPKVDKEHPGPPPPSAAKGGSSQSQQSSSSSGSSSGSGGSGEAQPKIHNKSQPDVSSEEVAKHNEEVAKRSGKQTSKDDEKVDPKFWKGHAEDKK